jgi:hypothetical protein
LAVFKLINTQRLLDYKLFGVIKGWIYLNTNNYNH